jgi:hypothetical protein
MIIFNTKPQESFTQCRMKLNGSENETNGFIPSWAAFVGNTVQVQELGEGQWTIESTGSIFRREAA